MLAGMPVLHLRLTVKLKLPRPPSAPRWRTFSHDAPRRRRHLIAEGITTSPFDDLPSTGIPIRSPYYFETGYSLFAKRQSRPFPPPFLSYPSGSFSDPLTTHHTVRDRRPKVNGELIKGMTNGDDAIIIGGQNFLAVNDGVGAWAQKERGHAALWSRLIAHFWAVEFEKLFAAKKEVSLDELDPIALLELAFEQTKRVTSSPNEILGTTTACSALLHHRSEDQPVVLATSLGDCAAFIIRPSGGGEEDDGEEGEIIYKTTEQWHWFDCPRQLGSNSPDTPRGNAVTDVVDVREDDLVVVMSDGVTDNLWEHEICTTVTRALREWTERSTEPARQAAEKNPAGGMVYVAAALMNAARDIAMDPYAESPYMERALDEGIAAEGGKLDDISVVVGLCKKRK